MAGITMISLLEMCIRDSHSAVALVFTQIRAVGKSYLSQFFFIPVNDEQALHLRSNGMFEFHVALPSFFPPLAACINRSSVASARALTFKIVITISALLFMWLVIKLLGWFFD